MKRCMTMSVLVSLSLLTVAGGGSASAEGVESGTKIEFYGTDKQPGVLDPEKQTPADPGTIAKTEGPLRIDFAPQLTFETSQLKGKALTASAHAQLFHGQTPPRGNFVQVSDYRDAASGWSLFVRQEQQFQHDTKAGSQLKGATISFDKSWTNSTEDASLAPTVSKKVIQMNNIGESYPLAQADTHKGRGTWSIIFGASSDNEHGQGTTLEALTDSAGKPLVDPAYENQPIYRNTAVNLTIPNTEQIEAGNYSTVLTWIIAELP